MATAVSQNGVGVSHPDKLFLGSCMSLISTSVAFAVVGAAMLSLKSQFVLDNAQVGLIGGAALWGLAVSQFVASPLVDRLGFKPVIAAAFVAHLIGPLLMITASGFWMLFLGAWVIALGNGLVEAACNPLVVALYPNNKTVKLNQFHVWFPGGIMIGGLVSYALDQIGIGSWQVKIGLVLIPTLIYGFLMLREKFPPTEGVSAGVSFGEMVKATFATPLMWLLLACMLITASTELGPGRWIPAVLEAGGMAGILVLAYINGLMAILRYNAGAFVHRVSPTGILFISAVLGAIGLFWLSYAESLGTAMAAATVFAFGVCFFWPTLLGVTSERVPRSGALGLGLMGAAGMLMVGAVTAPWMGSVADDRAGELLNQNPQAAVSVLQDVTTTYPALATQAPEAFRPEIQGAVTAAQGVLATYQQTNQLPAIETMNALRAVTGSQTAVQGAGDTGAGQALIGRAGAVLGPADNYGGRMSFRAIVPFTAFVALVFGLLYLNDRRKGGYRAEHISHGDLEMAQAKAKVSA